MQNTKRPRFLNANEVGKIMGFSERTITDWAMKAQESGDVDGIPCMKIGRQWRFPEEELFAWIEKKKISFG